MEEPKACIVTTLKGAEDTLLSWLLYHLDIGFHRIYLFFDDPNDSTLDIATRFNDARIEIILNDDNLKQKWQSLRSYSALQAYISNEVQARQHLNAELAATMALKNNIDWIVHIDVDELFGLTGEISLKEHLVELNASGISQLTYMNFEGCPTEEDIRDYFLEVTVFRRHLCAVPFNAETKPLIDFWKQRTKQEQYFIGYDNGKSIARVSEGLVPQSVHRWKLPSHDTGMSCSTMPDPRSLDLSRVYKCESVVILHYIICGFAWYWRKYQMLDAFPNHWFGGKLKISPCFHLESRDSFLTGRVESMRHLYQTQVMLNDQTMLNKQLQESVCIRFTKARDIILAAFKRKYGSDHPYLLKPEEWRATFHMPTPHDAAAPLRQPEDGPASTLNTLSLDKSWMVAQLVSRYLQDEFYQPQASPATRSEDETS